MAKDKKDGQTLGESGDRQMRGDAQQQRPHGEKLHGDKLASAQQGAESGDKVQGEGDYEAARRYRKDVEGFVKDEGDAGIAKKARDAEKAIEGSEADALRRAEQEGEKRARH